MQYDVHTIALLAIANNNAYIFVIITNSKILEYMPMPACHIKLNKTTTCVHH